MAFNDVSIFSPRTLKIYVKVTQVSQQAILIPIAGLQDEEYLVDRIMCQIRSVISQ